MSRHDANPSDAGTTWATPGSTKLSLGAWVAEGTCSAKRPRRSMFHRLFCPIAGYWPANSAKTVFDRAIFCYARLLPPRLLASPCHGIAGAPTLANSHSQ